jgi:hypothetical protein
MGKTLNDYPELLKEWHPTKNGDVKFEEIAHRSNNKYWWRCFNGIDHEWLATPDGRIGKGTGCPFCSKNKVSLSNCLAILRPDLIKEWHQTKNNLNPFNISIKSSKKVWWMGMCGHEWEAAVYERSANDSKCPYCTNRKIDISNCLATKYPCLVSQWHPTKNGKFTPYDIFSGSMKKFWWKCGDASDHEWEASPNDRTRKNGNRGCPCCCGRKVVLSNCLATLSPEIAKQWHPIKNKLTPYQVSFSSHKKVWWLGICGHEWDATINTRTSGKNDCPYCRGLRVNMTNSLAVIFPKIAAEWHLKKNGISTPNDYSAHSGKLVWWQCNKGHEWSAKISYRTQNKGNGENCPICNESKGEIKIREHLSRKNLIFTRQASFKSCTYKRKLPFDFLIKNQKEENLFLIEYNGEQHYKPIKFAGKKWTNKKAIDNFKLIKLKDKIKKNWCVKNNIHLLIIPYWEYENVEIMIDKFYKSLAMPSHGIDGKELAKTCVEAFMPVAAVTNSGIGCTATTTGNTHGVPLSSPSYGPQSLPANNNI